MINLIALDLDGTLIRSNGSVSQKTIKKLECLHENGTVIVFATGRSYIGLPENISCLHFVDYLISSNGTTVTRWSDNSVVYREWMPVDLACSIFKECSDLDVIPDALVAGVWHIDAYKYRKYNNIINDDVKKYIEKTRVMETDYDAFLKETKQGIEKIVINFAPSNEVIRNRINNLRYRYPIGVWSDKAHKLDIISDKASKGNALKWLAAFVKVDSDSIMAFGNDDNDISMMSGGGGVSVAVSNATASLKKSAKYVTASNDEDGVYQFLVSYNTIV